MAISSARVKLRRDKLVRIEHNQFIMKLTKIATATIATIAIFGFAGVALAAPLDLEIVHRNLADTLDVPQNLTPPTMGIGDNYIPYFHGQGGQGVYNWLQPGSGILTAGGTLAVTEYSIETPEGHLNDTLAGMISTTTANAILVAVANIPAPLNIGAFMGNNGSTTPYVASTTQNGFMSMAMVAKLNAVSTSTRAFSSPTRAVNTAYQSSTTRDTDVRASVDITTTLSLTGGTTGKVTLQYADDSGFTTNVVTVQQYTNSNTGTLTIGLNTSQIGTADLSGIIPAGKYYRLATTNTTGTPTFGTPVVSEVLLPT